MSEERIANNTQESVLNLLKPVATLVQNIKLYDLVHEEWDKESARRLEVEKVVFDSNPYFRPEMMVDSGVFARSYCPYGFGTGFAQDVYSDRKDEKIREALGFLENQIVVDLGAGRKPYGYFVADIAKAKGYIAVEPNFTGELLYRLSMIHIPDGEGWCKPSKDHVLNRTPLAVVEEDMLSFLRRLPDSSVSLFSAGIDDDVIPNKEYRKEVVKEIVRVLDPKGAYIGENFGGHISLDDSSGIQKTPIMTEKRKFQTGVTVYKKRGDDENDN